MTDYSLALKALADDSRQLILETLSDRAMSVRELTDRMPISQPAVSQHLDVLRKAGLVKVAPRGASNIYSIDPQGLGAVRQWLDRFWTQGLDNYAQLFDEDE